MLHMLTQGTFLLGCFIHCYTDFKEQLLYDEVSLVMLIMGLVECFYGQGIGSGLCGALVTGGAFWVLSLISQGGLGWGDVKLACVLGTWLGWQQGLLSLLLALCMGCCVGLVLIALRIKTRHDVIAFGPYMCLSGMLMLYYGQEIFAWYLGMYV